MKVAPDDATPSGLSNYSMAVISPIAMQQFVPVGNPQRWTPPSQLSDQLTINVHVKQSSADVFDPTQLVEQFGSYLYQLRRIKTIMQIKSVSISIVDH